MIRALVTGAAGFLGRHLARHLRAREWMVAGADLAPGSPGSGRAADPGAAPILACDVREPAEVARAFEAADPDVVFHLAGIAFVPAAERERALAFAVNATGTLHVLDAALARARRPRVVLASSAEVYGLPPSPETAFREDFPLRPRNFYGTTKVVAEEIGRHFAARGLEVVIARPFNHVGPGQSPDFVTADFARQVARAEREDPPRPIRVGNLDARRDFTDVRDALEAYRLLAERGRSGEAYNLASGRAVSIRDVLDRLRALARRPIPVEPDPDRMRPSDAPVLLGSTEKARAELGWEIRLALDETLSAILEDWRGRIDRHPHAPP